MKREPITDERHCEIGRELKRERDFLGSLKCELSRACGKSAKATRRARQAQEKIDELRCELDAAQTDSRTYYPGTEVRE